jgi:hypothetical protein
MQIQGTLLAGSGFYLRSRATQEKHMPVLWVPILWAAGGIVVLGGGYYVIAHMVH